jgi:hypothetical protein
MNRDRKLYDIVLTDCRKTVLHGQVNTACPLSLHLPPVPRALYTQRLRTCQHPGVMPFGGFSTIR